MLAARTTDPISTTRGAPIRSDKLPHATLPAASATKPMVIAVDTPVTDHPVSLDMGRSRTGNENIAPTAIQPNNPPAATMIQRYPDLVIMNPRYDAFRTV